MVTVNTSEMKKFYQNLDVIDFEYSLNKLKMSDVERLQKYVILEEAEASSQFMELTRIEYGDILSNLDMIYAREEKSNETVELFDLIRIKIISQYINIEGLERLFSEKYIDFEWDMHLGIDYKQHKMKFYRDHFMHQVRDAYSMHMLLDNGFMKKTQEILQRKGNSKVSSYVYKCVEQQKQRGSFYNILSEYEGYNESDFYYKNIIYMASYMAALFHDIGYPEAFHTINKRRITEYVANLYNAESSGYNDVRLNALLQNSLLFRVVSFEEIKDRLSDREPEHGTISAMMFLLNFYENGAIHRLEPYKRCAVELAALAIYNHTNQYSYENVCEKGEYARISFKLNPISYLLRICDDLQEWDRIYFELSNSSNLILCNKCKTPILRRYREEFKGDYHKKKYYYICNCNINADTPESEEKGVFTPMFDYDENFPYRRIYNVTVCRKLEFEIDKENVTFRLKYDLDKLLHIAYINPEYAKYRIKELNKLKKLLDYQESLYSMRIDYFVTANPILIKVRIMEEYLERCVGTEGTLPKIREFLLELFELGKEIDEMEDEPDKIKKIEEWDAKFKKKSDVYIDHCDSIINELYDCELRASVKESVSLYVKLALFMQLNRMWNQKCEIKSKEPEGFLKARETKLIDIEGYAYDENLQELIRDCLKQFSGMYENIATIASNSSNYYKQFESIPYTYGCIKRFLSPQMYIPISKRKKMKTERGEYIDAFTDLAFIGFIWDKVKAAIDKQRTEGLQIV